MDSLHEITGAILSGVIFEIAGFCSILLQRSDQFEKDERIIMLVKVFRAACLLAVPFLRYQNGKWKRLSYVLNRCVKIKRSVVDEYGKRERLTPPTGTLTNIYFARKEICKKSRET